MARSPQHAILDSMLHLFIVSSRNKGSKQYPVTLHVMPVPDGAPGLAAVYAGSDPYGHFSIGDVWYTYTATVTTVPGQPHWISIKNYRGLGDSISVMASVVSSDQDTYWIGSINIPIQTVHGYTIYGNGKGSMAYRKMENHGSPSMEIPLFMPVIHRLALLSSMCNNII